MRYILNSAVITAPGTYKYHLISPESMTEWLRKGVYKSTIGYEETALAIYVLSGEQVPVNREQIQMQKNDEALVFRLTKRLSTGEMKGQIGVKAILGNCEIGVLRRLN